MTLEELRTHGALEELAKVFAEKADADELLDRVDFPRPQRPPASKPLHYWRGVCRDVESGLIDGGLERLLVEASRLRPGNEVFGKLVGTPPRPPRIAPTGDPEARVRSTVPVRSGLPFVGRAREQEEVAEFFSQRSERTAVFVLHGKPGVGKSELAFEYGRRHPERYPGGTFVIHFQSEGHPTDLATLGRSVLDLPGLEGLPLADQCQVALAALGQEPTLLVYDDLPREDVLRTWLPVTGSRCHVLVTSNWETWTWGALEVDPLPDEAARQLVEALGGTEVAARYGEELVRSAAGLPVQLAPAATILRSQVKRQLGEPQLTSLAGPAESSFERAWSRLSEGERFLMRVAVLFAWDRLPVKLLEQRIVEDSGWTHEPWTHVRFVEALNGCMNFHLIEGRSPELQIHQLVARFVWKRPISDKDRSVPEPLRRAHSLALFEAASVFEQSPADPELASRLLSFPLERSRWPERIARSHDIAKAVGELGRYEDALPWFKGAVAEKEQGDIDGRVDHASLGRSVHQVGVCYSHLGRSKDALAWFKRAVAEMEQGDVDGRVNHARLGRSLSFVGDCYSHLGRWEDALPWFERAVAEEEQGDVKVRVDHANLGRSLRFVGVCYSNLGRYEEALPWCERAVKESEQGTVHDRMDHDNLGSSVHQLASCYSNLGRYAEALPRFERAVKEAELGDVHGRVNHENLGSSVHQGGVCYSHLGRWEEALVWFVRAVAEKEQGDVYDRVNHASLGRSLSFVGYCHSLLDRGEDALSWFERAVTEKEQGDVYGRVDYQSLGNAVHHVGLCYSHLDRWEDALPWFERAAAEKKQGDVHGRVDHESLGRSVHQVGSCYSELRRYEDALPWFERAIAEKKQGDVHGRVDHDSLGSSVHLVGYCYSSQGRYDEALPWFEHAVAEKEQGDVHGRVDHESLGSSASSLQHVRSRLEAGSD